jgi:diacylglycerol kinase family enzyme
MERVIGSDHVFYSRSLDEAEAFTREIVQRGYGTILSGGGDGTLCRTVNLVQRYIDESNAWRRERAQRYGERQSLIGTPRFGFLRLGTGNGITDVIGAKDPLRDLKTVVDYAPGRTHDLPLIESGGERFFFGGLGYDSMLLDDYNALKEATASSWLRPFTHSLGGYFAALATRTVPRLLFKGMSLEGQVVTRGKAFYVDPRRGDAAVEIEPGSTLFEGKARIIAAGTSPFFGYGFRMFPFSNIMPGMMQLRIATMGTLTTLAAVPSVWKGSYRNPDHVFDFLVEDVDVELDGPFPFQHSGDAQGSLSRLEMRVADEPLRLVDFYKPRPTG